MNSILFRYQNNIIRFLVLVLAISIMNACSIGVRPILIDDQLPKDKVIDYTINNNPKFCAYKGKVVISIKNGQEDFNFNALIDKKCNGDMNMVILGALNMAVANFSFVDGVMAANSKKDGDITNNISDIISTGDVQILIDFMNTDKFYPKNNDMMKRTLEYYIFKRENMDVFVNERFYISGYITPELNVVYDWGIKEPQALILSNNKGMEFKVKFNEKNWIKYDKKN